MEEGVLMGVLLEKEGVLVGVLVPTVECVRPGWWDEVWLEPPPCWWNCSIRSYSSSSGKG